LWFLPIVFVVGAACLAAATIAVDQRWDAAPAWLAFNGGPDSAQRILTTIITSMMTFTGLVFSITIVALQLASSQFSPRVLRAFLRDRGSQTALGVFIATFVFALSVLVRVRTGSGDEVFVPRVSVSVAIVLVMVSLVTFVYYVNHIAQSIRVVNIIEAVAAESREVIDHIYPAGGEVGAPSAEPPTLSGVRELIRLPRRGGVVTGLDVAGLVEIARRHDCVLRLVPDMGDYVAEGAVVIEVRGGTGQVSSHEVLRQVSFAPERSMRQDPAYGLRQLVDIAEKALSPTLNDPTTAVQALDRIHDLLGRVLSRAQPSGVYCDAEGEIRFVRKVVSWSGLVTLAFEEVRGYGATSIQVHRRLRASLEDLLEIAPPDRCEPLRRQLRLQRQSAIRNFPEPEARELAAEGDESGLGNEDGDGEDRAVGG
jgi:uncharacterized membrane protein